MCLRVLNLATVIERSDLLEGQTLEVETAFDAEQRLDVLERRLDHRGRFDRGEPDPLVRGTKEDLAHDTIAGEDRTGARHDEAEVAWPDLPIRRDDAFVAVVICAQAVAGFFEMVSHGVLLCHNAKVQSIRATASRSIRP
jgi:hypothetical protein